MSDAKGKAVEHISCLISVVTGVVLLYVALCHPASAVTLMLWYGGIKALSNTVFLTARLAKDAQ